MIHEKVQIGAPRLRIDLFISELRDGVVLVIEQTLLYTVNTVNALEAKYT